MTPSSNTPSSTHSIGAWNGQQPLPITGILLAGGAGRRMGGADKGWLNWRGTPLIAQALTILRDDCAEIIISANRNLDRYAQWGYRVVSDPAKGFQGPLMGLAAGMAAASQPWVASIPVDSPRLPHDLVRRMWQAKEGRDLLVVRGAERWHAVICLCRRELWPHLQDYLDNGGRRAQDWFQDLPYASLTLSAEALYNCNHPEDMT